MGISQISDVGKAIADNVAKAVVGQKETVDLLLVGLLAEGHMLLEGPPGLAKTLLVQAFSRTLGLSFKRIQFTPDLMPSDLLGTNIFDFKSGQFTLTKGPIFTEMLLADEINRTPPKTQAALLEAMQERSVTLDGTSHELGDGFMVIATQNPIEQQGTYPLPEAQLDRFMFKLEIGYPSEEEELVIVKQHGRQDQNSRALLKSIPAVVDLAKITDMRRDLNAVELSDDLVGYIVNLVRSSREHAAIEYGVSPRCAAQMARAGAAMAALAGREYVIPDDIKTLAKPMFRHRLVPTPGADIEGLTPDRLVDQIVAQVPAPR